MRAMADKELEAWRQAKRRGVGKPQGIARPRKVAPWREAERYFQRYRDTKKVIPLRAKVRVNGKADS